MLLRRVDQAIEDYTITDEKAHDSTQFDTGPWLKDRLVLFDRAYLCYRRFALIDENGGYLLTPVNDPAHGGAGLVSELGLYRI